MNKSNKKDSKMLSLVKNVITTNEEPIINEYVRLIIEETHKAYMPQKFWESILQLPLKSDHLSTWKFCQLLHKVLKDGHKLCTYHGVKYCNMLKDIGNYWRMFHPFPYDDGYGHCIEKYIRLLCNKLKFHEKHTHMAPSLILTGDELKGILLSDSNVQFNLAIDILNYLDDIILIEKEIFSTRLTYAIESVKECRFMALSTLIEESKLLYFNLIHIMDKLHENLEYHTLQGHREHFLNIFIELKAFYEKSNKLKIFTLWIPKMVDTPPQFLEINSNSTAGTSAAFVGTTNNNNNNSNFVENKIKNVIKQNFNFSSSLNNTKEKDSTTVTDADIANAVVTTSASEELYDDYDDSDFSDSSEDNEDYGNNNNNSSTNKIDQNANNNNNNNNKQQPSAPSLELIIEDYEKIIKDLKERNFKLENQVKFLTNENNELKKQITLECKPNNNQIDQKVQQNQQQQQHQLQLQPQPQYNKIENKTKENILRIPKEIYNGFHKQQIAFKMNDSIQQIQQRQSRQQLRQEIIAVSKQQQQVQHYNKIEFKTNDENIQENSINKLKNPTNSNIIKKINNNSSRNISKADENAQEIVRERNYSTKDLRNLRRPKSAIFSDIKSFWEKNNQ